MSCDITQRVNQTKMLPFTDSKQEQVKNQAIKNNHVLLLPENH